MSHGESIGDLFDGRIPRVGAIFDPPPRPEPPRKPMVVGFAFDRDGENVLLIEKLRPAWMAGRLNGPGGKLEGDETPRLAMTREFQEETGILAGPDVWSQVAHLDTDHGTTVTFFALHDFTYDQLAAVAADPPTDERLVLCDTDRIWRGDRRARNVLLPNLRFLIPMAWHVLTHEPLDVAIVERTPA